MAIYVVYKEKNLLLPKVEVQPLLKRLESKGFVLSNVETKTVHNCTVKVMLIFNYKLKIKTDKRGKKPSVRTDKMS